MAMFLGSCTRYRVFVGEAYMPPGKGAPHAGFAGNHPFPPVCRAGVHARRTRSAANTCLAHLPVVPVRFVGAACMRPVGVRLMATFFGLCTRYRVFVGAAYMPPGRGERPRGVCGKTSRFPRFVGRGFTPAAPIINFKIIIMCGGRNRPPYNARYTPGRPGTGQRRKVRGPHTCGPYNARYTPYKP